MAKFAKLCSSKIKRAPACKKNKNGNKRLQLEMNNYPTKLRQLPKQSVAKG